MGILTLIRPVGARMLETAERDGVVVDRTPAERQACLRLNAKGLLRRDRRDAATWYPVIRRARR
ncbi:hypothetical protein HJB56_05000 [Rhizobium lentis]|uniref:hypothetical protein n=1 Tax=Rhizobium lentis TaxID=1138194 RepID=UPI001C83F2B3|nr:hypothetical protein [Rhizobium lentis]MBX5082144.1 hypothetical protein [Rhizobium lentis]MBX5094854.1 hypothetical protein [Rhizobium lentis]MBX5119579.1 hypothetical protein [Rhizobium lentis]